MTEMIKRVVEAGWFHHGIVAVIVLAGLVAGLETSQAVVQEHGAVLHALDLLILGIFALEALLKMAAHGRRPWVYFADGWNVFDFLIIVICVLPVGGPFAAVLRLARALRLLRLVSTLPKLQLLVGALLKSLSAMGYVSLLLALMFYIYGVVGIHLFGAHDPKNFGSLPAAFLSLFRLVTLDNWADLFSAQIAHVSGVKVAIYFVTFIVFGTMIILNLFIGIIMNSMADMHAEIEARDRARHEKDLGHATFMDEFNALEHQLDGLKEQTARLKRRLARQPNHREEPAVLPKADSIVANCGRVRRMAEGIKKTTRPGTGRAALSLAGWLVLTFAAAAMGGFFTPGDWYASLKKPVWNPPNWIFGPVWAALYVIMAITAWLVWKRGGFSGQRIALSLFLLQLLLNALWSPLFFGLHLPGLAFVDLVLLWLALLATLTAFWKTHLLAGAMLLSYLAWVTFAGALNFALWRLNPA